MTDILDELERLHAAATQGEWRVRVDAPNYIATGHGNEFANAAKAYDPNDAAFIVAAHNRMPTLLAYVRALEAVAYFVGDPDSPRGRAVSDALDAARARLNGGK